jgi:outer membrane protein
MCKFARGLIGGLLLLQAGCAMLHPDVPAAALSQRILPPPDPAMPPSQTPARLGAPVEALPTPRSVPREEGAPVGLSKPLIPPTPPTPPAETGALTLERALDMAQRANPNLQAMREGITQAEGGQIVSFAEFLPDSRIVYRHIEDRPGSEPFALPTLPTNLAGNVAFGGNANRFDLTELHLQWTLCDFGRRAGKYGQAGLSVDIARLQYRRGLQSVAFSVAAQYFAVLQAEATARVAEEAVRRTEIDLRDARNFLRRGVGLRNQVLRTEALLAEMRLDLIKARTARSVAVAGLNQAIGINVSADTRIVDRRAAPPFALPLEDCLQLAVSNREEFRVVLDSIRSAQFGVGVAQADFTPRVLVGGVAAHELNNIGVRTNLVAGGLAIDLVLFEGGKRLGQVRMAEAKARAALAQGKEVCDRIAYEVNVAYVAIADARERMVQSQKATTAGTENLRVVRSQLERGDVSPTDVADAELILVRAQQSYYTALYDYQIALARLAYAVGLPVGADWTVRGGDTHHE